MGHLFIINGDVTKLACDAILIPTDAGFKIEPHWSTAISGHEDELAELRRKSVERWGSKKTLRLNREAKRPWVWLGKVGMVGEDWNFKTFEPVVEEFVRKAARVIKIEDGRRIYGWPLPRVAVNLVGSGRGGGAQRKGDLVCGLVEKLSSLAGLHQVDIVLVTFGAKPYAAAQRARRLKVGDRDTALRTNWVFTDRRKADLIRCGRGLAENAIRSHLVLFIGAGASAGAGLPQWNDLLAGVAKDAGMEPESRKHLRDKDPRDQATILEGRLKGQDLDLKKLKKAVAQKLDSSHYALLHGLLASLPSTEAVTTNFDCLFETAWTTDGRQPTILPESAVDADGRWLLKLHGSVHKSDDMVLTRSDYMDMPRRHGALMGLVQGLLMMRHMMFVGYSLRDEDFHELIHEVRTARGETTDPRPLGTVLTLYEDHLEQELWGHDLHIVPMTAPRRKECDDPEAARQLEIFIDLVAYLSATSAAFFLDETYDELSEAERDLRDHLRQLANATKKAPPGKVAFRVSQFLQDELGAEVVTESRSSRRPPNTGRRARG